jgi:hypothetical protein
MDKRTLQCARLREAVLSNCYAQRLILCGFFLTVITDVQADNPLPAITVTGRATPTPGPLDTVGRDCVERSPEMHWPTPMFNRAAEIFAHNQIVINVVECVPPNWLGWRSFGRAWIRAEGPVVSSYHNWYIKPMGPQKCVVTFGLWQGPAFASFCSKYRAGDRNQRLSRARNY